MARRTSSPAVHVVPRPEGWAPLRAGADRPPKVYSTQSHAEQRGREMLRGLGGGELVTHNKSGRFRSKDTIGGNDPMPPRDREH